MNKYLIDIGLSFLFVAAIGLIMFLGICVIDWEIPNMDYAPAFIRYLIFAAIVMSVAICVTNLLNSKPEDENTTIDDYRDNMLPACVNYHANAVLQLIDLSHVEQLSMPDNTYMVIRTTLDTDDGTKAFVTFHGEDSTVLSAQLVLEESYPYELIAQAVYSNVGEAKE